MVTLKERHERMEKIKELYYIRRLNLRQCAEALGLNIRTIVNYVGKINKEIEEELQKTTIDEVVKIRLTNHSRSIERMWRAYDKSDAPYRQANIIFQIEKIQSQFIDDLQKLGIVYKTPESTNLNVNIEAITDRLTKFIAEEAERQPKAT